MREVVAHLREIRDHAVAIHRRYRIEYVQTTRLDRCCDACASLRVGRVLGVLNVASNLIPSLGQWLTARSSFPDPALVKISAKTYRGSPRESR